MHVHHFAPFTRRTCFECVFKIEHISLAFGCIETADQDQMEIQKQTDCGANGERRTALLTVLIFFFWCLFMPHVVVVVDVVYDFRATFHCNICV